MIIQGREITLKDIALIREMISSHPSWGRTRISKELSTLWRWQEIMVNLRTWPAVASF